MPTTYDFGTTKITGKNDWLIQSKTNTQSGQEALALDESGEPVVAHYYQKTSEVSFQAIIPTADSTIPEVGDIFAYNGVKYYVMSVTQTESNTNFVTYDLTVKRFLANNLPSNS